jgi:hypothetical protein
MILREFGVTRSRGNALNCRFCIELAAAIADRGDTAKGLCFVSIRGRPVTLGEIQIDAQRTFGAATRCW